MLLSHVQLFVTPWTVARQAPLSMKISRQEYWSGLLFPPLGESSQPRDRTCISCVSCINRQILHHCTTWVASNLADVSWTPDQTPQRELPGESGEEAAALLASGPLFPPPRPSRVMFTASEPQDAPRKPSSQSPGVLQRQGARAACSRERKGFPGVGGIVFC